MPFLINLLTFSLNFSHNFILKQKKSMEKMVFYFEIIFYILTILKFKLKKIYEFFRFNIFF